MTRIAHATGNRRQFLRNTSRSAGFGLAAPLVGSSLAGSAAADRARLPREVWVATVSQEGLSAETPGQMITLLLERMESVASLKPDIVCLPEVAPFVNLEGGRTALERAAETPLGPFSSPFADFARKYACYVFIGMYTRHEGRIFNAMVLVDRKGELVGEYQKMHPTEGEIEGGITPGPLDPPVFKTDFGRIGGQICFDIEWQDGWSALQKKRAEIVFWPSAFGGGSKLNMLANLNRYIIVSSTRKGVSQVCDISGETIAWTGLWDRSLCVPVNLEKTFIHTWPHSSRFPDIRKKYGQAVRIETFHEEEWTIIESRSPDLKVADLLREFEIETYEEMVRGAETAQNRARS